MSHELVAQSCHWLHLLSIPLMKADNIQLRQPTLPWQTGCCDSRHWLSMATQPQSTAASAGMSPKARCGCSLLVMGAPCRGLRCRRSW